MLTCLVLVIGIFLAIDQEGGEHTMPVIRIGTAAYDVATGHQPPPQLPGITNLDRLADDSILLANGVRIESMVFAPTVQGGALPLGEEAAAGTVLSIEQTIATPEGAFTVQSGAVDLGGGQLQAILSDPDAQGGTFTNWTIKEGDAIGFPLGFLEQLLIQS